MIDYVEQCDPDVMTVERNAVEYTRLLNGGSRRRWTLAQLVAMEPASLRKHAWLPPVGTVEFCRAWMRATGIPEPVPLDYPSCLRDALGRDIRRMAYAKAPTGFWIKPIQTKAWEAHVKAPDERGKGEVWATLYVDISRWQGEWRVYVDNGQIVGIGRYDDLDDEDLDFDHRAISRWISALEMSGEATAGYALDVAVVDGKTILVEATDGWAIGYYSGTCTPRAYTRLLQARWGQISHG